MAKEARKLRRAATKKDDDGTKKPLLNEPMKAKQVEVPDPLRGDAFKKLLMRLAIPLVAVWMVGVFVSTFTHTTTGRSLALGLPALATALLLGVVFWAIKQARKAQSVAGILNKVETAEDRRAALGQLETAFKKKDPAAIFARAQLELQEDPKKALVTLQTIDLGKVQASVADEARTQRAMIHLLLGEVSEARPLADGIEVSRHQDAKSRAMMTAVIGEAWARSGQAKKAVDTLGLIDPEDPEYVDLRAQLYRAHAYAFAHSNDMKGMKRSVRRLAELDMRLLGGFLGKRAHPLLQKEAKRVLEQSGQMPRKMVVQRRM
ncbi:MAG: hypothetical protein IPI67_18165 [Myxococcales bacterium]|nr:hypothetical protein [Myxococcales bacterium]